jgi:hypothetical protein
MHVDGLGVQVLAAAVEAARGIQALRLPLDVEMKDTNGVHGAIIIEVYAVDLEFVAVGLVAEREPIGYDGVASQLNLVIGNGSFDFLDVY